MLTLQTCTEQFPNLLDVCSIQRLTFKKDFQDIQLQLDQINANLEPLCLIQVFIIQVIHNML